MRAEKGDSRVLSDMQRERIVMRKIIVAAFMALLGIFACIILGVLRLSSFWHYVFLAAFLALTVAAFVQVCGLGTEIGWR